MKGICNKKTLALLLALCSLLGCFFSFASCGQKTDPPADSTAAEQTEASTEAPARETFELVIGGSTKAAIIRPDASALGSSDVKAAIGIAKALSDFADDATLALTTDWTKDGTHSAEAVEILVGQTNYAESAEVYRTLGYGDFAVRCVGNKIVVAGYTDTAIAKAADTLSALFGSSASDGAAGKDVVLNAASLNVRKTVSEKVSDIPLYEGGTGIVYYDSGEGCNEIIVNGTDKAGFDAYRDKLTKLGYTLYTSHEMNGNFFATLYSDTYTVNAGFYKNDNTVRIIFEPFSPKTLIGLEADNKYETVTSSRITMLGMGHYDANNELKGNGLAIVIRLTDGRFVIVDGGFHWDNHINQMVSTLKEQSKDYSDKTGIVVAAWIITHAHGDHNGLFKSKYTALKSNKITVQRFLINDLSEAELSKSYATYPNNYSEVQSERSAMEWVPKAAKVLGAEVITAHVGQVYYFADLRMEMLYTIESMAPAVCNALNATSLVAKMTFTDEKTGKETVYMSTGDATGAALQICAKMYGDYLKSDIVQVAHHGGSTWGNDGGTASAYKLMIPTVVLYPAGDSTYEKNSKETRNATLLNVKTNPNFEEVFVASWDGSVTSLPIPYTVGTATVSLKPAPAH